MKQDVVNLIKAGFIYICGSFFSQGLRFITLPIFSRLLSAEDYGYISAYETWVSIMTILVGMQTYVTIANAYIDFKGKRISEYTATVCTVGCGSFLLLCVITFFFRNIFETVFEIPVGLLLIGLLQCFFSYVIMMLCGEYRILEKPWHYITFSISISILSVFGAGSLIVLSIFKGYIGYVLGYAIANIFIGSIALFLVYKKGKKFISLKNAKYSLKISFPLIIHNLASVLLARTNQFVLLKAIGVSAAGLYSFGNNFAFIVNALYTACMQAYIPWYYRQLSAGNIDNVKIFAKKYIKLFTYIVAGLILVMPEIVVIMATPEYYEVTKIVPIVIAAMYVNFLYTFAVNYECYHKCTKYIAMGTIITAVVNVLLNLLLVEHYKIYGAAISTLLSSIALFAIHYFIVKNIIKNFELNIKTFITGVSIITIIVLLYYLLLSSTVTRISIAILIIIICIAEVFITLKKSI